MLSGLEVQSVKRRVDGDVDLIPTLWRRVLNRHPAVLSKYFGLRSEALMHADVRAPERVAGRSAEWEDIKEPIKGPATG
ncbi:hypothetical protein EYF80_064002 [Liparis tanakae]|uniref:Uncharacterized protein n=1 Tax=Liparis tanakae TaxID=230148 RepID=A0A4Z2EAJ7_9TELE|nr:hypothetical protein EYF80_064002 [Liparis tanakae]